ncbi:small hydrophobic protein [Longquan Niviventer fulvescens jeilongvirus 1]|uniref:Small hydrophobic protein n=1 Tax=Longquan Niviventer fulvescens jeilongvirus 1 TaxID=2877481 RepID=A0AAE8XRV0_9MONO|nr:small hydrophobic protein [Longquan Niviventer fulvescens jeilongvirus 1]
MERDVSIALFTIYFVCIFWSISSIIWFVYLTAKMYTIKHDIQKKLNILNNEVIFLQELERERDLNFRVESGPPPYTQV